MVGVSDVTSSIESAKALSTADPATLGNFSKGLQAGVQNFCKAYGNNQAVFSLSFLGAAADEICAPYFADQGLPKPESTPPYTGGQCAVQYLVKTSGRQTNGFGVWTDNEAAVIGPLGGIAYFKPGTGYGVFIENGFGNLQAISPYTSPFNPIELTAGPTVRRADGNPDNCGDPDPVFKPSGGPNYNFGDVISITNDNGTVTNVVVNEPTLSVKGELNIPVSVDGVNVNLGGGSPEVPSGERPPVEAQPALSPGDLAANDGDFPDPPEGQKYVGAAWRIIEFPPSQYTLPGTTLNKVLTETVGNFALKVQSENGESVGSTSVRIQAETGYITEEATGLTIKGVYANVKPFYQLEVVPLTASIQ